jgi:HD-GYP domain-containing protein (c-di-GMP phosphodiesterase class II)
MLDRLRKAYIPIFTQITVPYILLAMVIAAGGTFIVTSVIFDSVEERFTNQLIETALLAQESLVRQEEDLLEDLRLASNIQGVDLAVQSRDLEQTLILLLPAAYNAGVEALVVLDASGGELLSLQLNAESLQYEQLVSSAAYGGQDFVRRTLRGEVDEAGDKHSGVVHTEVGDYFFVSGPITDSAGSLSGVALTGRSLQSLANTVRSETFAHLSFYTLLGQPLASTLQESGAVITEQAQELIDYAGEASLGRTFVDNSINYNEWVSLWQVREGQTMGLIGVSLPTHFLVQASQFTRNNTLLLTSLALLLVVLIGVFVAGRITRPIRDLKTAAQSVERGDLQVMVKSGGRDEVGVLAQSFNRMVASVSKSKQDLLDAYDATIEGWAQATDLRDHETQGHSRRVADLAVALAESMGFKGDELVQMRRGALLHDVGKIAVPDSILLKKGKLTPEERLEMQKHPGFAKTFIEQIDFLKPAMDVPYAHHEKWDGTGYPRGLKGEQIPMAARIFAVVDVWDALTSDRPYREAMSFQDTLKHIEADSGRHFDPEVVTAFKRLIGRAKK